MIDSILLAFANLSVICTYKENFGNIHLCTARDLDFGDKHVASLRNFVKRKMFL